MRDGETGALAGGFPQRSRVGFLRRTPPIPEFEGEDAAFFLGDWFTDAEGTFAGGFPQRSRVGFLRWTPDISDFEGGDAAIFLVCCLLIRKEHLLELSPSGGCRVIRVGSRECFV